MKLSRLLENPRRRPGTAVYLLLVTLLGLPLVAPLLRWTQVPCTHDGHLYYYRLAAMRHTWESGLPFARWRPDVVFGYGYPFFNYREAVSLYAGLLPHLLGIPLPAALNFLHIVGILAAGWFMFLWARDVFGALAGLVAAVAYMAAPFLLIDALIRGSLNESLALALLPLLAWSGRRFVREGKAWAFTVSSLSLALLALSHNISAFLFTPFLLAYLVAIGWWRHLPWQTLAIRLALLFGLGLGLAAFYVGPAILELDQITIRQAVSTRGNSFVNNFTTLNEIFAPASPADPALLNAPLFIRLGWAPALLALLGIVSLKWTYSKERRGHILFMGASAIGLLCMALAISTSLWERLPLIEFVQFPWRFIGRAALPVAFLAGAPIAALEQWAAKDRFQVASLLSAAAILVLLLEATPGLYPHLCRQEARPTINAVHEYERSTGLLGVDAEGSYFPITVLSRPAGSPLEADYQAGRVPDRFNRDVLPSGAAVESIEYGPLSAHAEVISPRPFQAQYLSYDFPGWQVRVNGQETPITPSDPEGLITFPVPAGASVIEVGWVLTPLRQALSVVSIVALAGVLLVAIVLARRRSAERESQEAKEQGSRGSAEPVDGERAIWVGLLLIGVVAVGFLAFKVLLVDRGETPLRRATLPDVSYPATLSGAELVLAGHNLSQNEVAAGDTFNIDLAWQVQAPPQADYQSSVWLSGPAGLTWSEKETHRPRIYEDTASSRLWLPGQWAWDSHEVQVLPGTPPGQYDIVMTLFDLADLKQITLADAAGSVVGPMGVIGQIEVVRPAEPRQLSPQHIVDDSFGGLRLLGFSQDRRGAIPGEEMLLTLFWQKTDGFDLPPDDLRLELLTGDGRVSQSWRLPPVRADYPPELWPVGEGQRGQHALRLSGGLESGDYVFELEGRPLGDLKIDAPERSFAEPDFETAAGADFAGQAELIGYTLEIDSPGPQLATLELVWRGTAEMPVSYRVFVHLVNANGQIVAQSDAEPADWARPTTGWAVGEYVVDQHVLPLPDGQPADDLTLRIGLYDAQNGQRLPVNGQDAFQALLNSD